MSFSRLILRFLSTETISDPNPLIESQQKTEQKSYLHRKGILITRGLSHSPWPTSNFTIKNHLFHPPPIILQLLPLPDSFKNARIMLTHSDVQDVSSHAFGQHPDLKLLGAIHWWQKQKADKLTINLNHVKIYCVDRSMYCNIFCCSWKKKLYSSVYYTLWTRTSWNLGESNSHNEELTLTTWKTNMSPKKGLFQ